MAGVCSPNITIFFQKKSPVPSTQGQHGIRVNYNTGRAARLGGGAGSARRGWIVPMIPIQRSRSREGFRERARSETVLEVREGGPLTERRGFGRLREGGEAPAGGDAGAGWRRLNPRLRRRRRDGAGIWGRRRRGHSAEQENCSGRAGPLEA